MTSEETRQAKEILENNGRCPNVCCFECVVGILGEIKYCNPSYAIDFCKELLED